MAISTRSDLVFIMRNTVPVPGERRAVVESWINLLRDAGVPNMEIDREIGRAESMWRSRAVPYATREGGSE